MEIRKYVIFLLMASGFIISCSSHPEKISGVIVQYNGYPAMGCKVYLKSENYCDSVLTSKGGSFTFFIPQNIKTKNMYIYGKINCCISDTIFLSDYNYKNSIDVKIQTSVKCNQRQNYVYNPIEKSKYYLNFVHLENDLYQIELGKDILKKDKINIDFYMHIDPEFNYSFDKGYSINGADFISKKKLHKDTVGNLIINY